jgi:hypothetical protein
MEEPLIWLPNENFQLLLKSTTWRGFCCANNVVPAAINAAMNKNVDPDFKSFSLRGKYLVV